MNTELRSGLHAMWAAVAPGWGEHADYVEEHGAVITAAMLEAARLTPGDRVLELACGPGGAGIAAAERAADVVLSDVAAEMTAIAAARAAARGLTNVTTRVLDLEDIDEPDDSFDVVLCREGLMFALDPAGAVDEVRRVLRPGGRAAIAVWGPRERNPWLGLLMDAVSEQVGAPIPPPGVPGPFALGEDDRFAQALGDVAVSEVTITQRAASFDEWWSVRTALAGPLAKMLALQPPDAIAAMKARAREKLRPYADGDGYALPGVTLLGSVTA
jgi:SAM-dependent methyltransferase